MMQNLNQMTNTELKRYLSEHRNQEEAIRKKRFGLHCKF
ncbi:DUF6887 family protein [Nostoc sp.]